MKKFIRILKSDIKRLIVSKSLYFSIFGVVFLCFLNLWNDIYMRLSNHYEGNVLYYIILKRGLGAFFMAMTVICVIPSGLGHCADIKNNYKGYILSKTNITKYCWSKIIASVLGGFLCVFLGYMIFFGGLSLFFPIAESDPEILNQYMETSRYVVMIEKSPVIYWILEFSSEALGYGFLASVAMTFSVLTDNVFVVLSMPIIFYYFTDFLNSVLGLPLILRWYQVMENGGVLFTVQDSNWADTYLKTIFYFAVLIGITGMVFVKMMKIGARDE